MAKNVYLTIDLRQATLVAIGWIAFFLGALMDDLSPAGAILLMAVARVLP